MIYILVLAVFALLYFITKSHSDQQEESSANAKLAVQLTERFKDHDVYLFCFEREKTKRHVYVLIESKGYKDQDILYEKRPFYVLDEEYDDKDIDRIEKKLVSLRNSLPYRFKMDRQYPYDSWEKYLKTIQGYEQT